MSSSNPIFSEYKKPNFHIIRAMNDLNTAETVDGLRVHREKKLFFPEIKRSVVCASYDNHFVFEDSRRKGWTLFCTCGSPAVIAGFRAYARDASPSSKEFDTIPGELLICYHHSLYNKHLDGSS